MASSSAAAVALDRDTRAQVTAKPFIKWAGGKARLLPRLLPHVPASFRRYFEPFVGGGSMLMAVSSRSSRGAVASDLNQDLITAWTAVQSDPAALHAALEDFAKQDSEDFYYDVRAKQFTDPLTRAAHFIYLNRTSWNGLYRVNRWGKFNVPWGARTFTMPSLDALEEVAKHLESVEIGCWDFREVLERPQRGDFVYLDPPYLRISDTSKFNGYTQKRFRSEDLADLADTLATLRSRGASWMMSNRDSQEVSELFGGFRIVRLRVQRSVAAQNRRHVEARHSPEVIVMSD